MPHDDLPIDEEQYESIPWGSLVAQANDRPLLVYVAAGAVVALVVGVLIARTARPSASVATPITSVIDEPTPPSPSTSVFTEADLRAELLPGDDGSRSAVARAEWFVTDYFTHDPAGGRTDQIADALGRSIALPEPVATTYVEWARAWASEHEGDGRYRVSVAYRSITSTENGFVRGHVHGVVVRVQLSPDDGSRVLDLPEPVPLPLAPPAGAPPVRQPVPEDVAVRAREQAGVWGGPVEIVDGFEESGSWSVYVNAEDDQGTVWPLSVRVEPAGPETENGP